MTQPALPARHASNYSRRLAALVLVTVVALPAIAAEHGPAFDANKAALAMGHKGMEAYERGEYAKSADLFVNAWKTDKSEPEFLFSAARAQQLCGRQDQAAASFREFIAHPKARPDRVKRAQTLLAEIERARMDARVQEGQDAAAKGDHKLAATIWLQAQHDAPERVELLYKAAVAKYQSGDAAGAKSLLEQYLSTAPSAAPDRAAARARLDALREPGKPAGGAAAQVESKPRPSTVEDTRGSGPVTAPVQVESPGATTASKWPAWVIAGSGGAIALAGLGVFLSTLGDLKTYNTASGANGTPPTVTLDEAQSQYQSLHNRDIAAAVMGGVGLVGVGIGVWMLVQEPTRSTAMVPTQNGLSLVGRF